MNKTDRVPTYDLLWETDTEHLGLISIFFRFGSFLLLLELNRQYAVVTGFAITFVMKDKGNRNCHTSHKI